MDPVPVQPRRSSLGLYFFGIVLLGAAAAGTYYYVHNGLNGLSEARASMAVEAARGPRLVVANVTQGPTERVIQLLGDAKAYSTVTLFAKVSGYVKSVSVDKGDSVKAGQVVAEIESLEIDSQLQSAIADLDYKQRIAARARELLRSGATAQQAADLAEANYRMAQEAVKNLGTMKAYQVIKAPFDGTVVGRFADQGALMQAATTNQASSLPVIQIADNTKLRIGAYVEQRDVAAVHVGDEADIVDASNTERRRRAKISRTSGTLDPRTRTLFIELDLDNRDQFLVPGSFVNVVLRVPVASYPQVPVAAILQRAGNTQLAMVGADQVVKFRQVRVAGTDGVMVDVPEGVKPGEKVGLNVGNDVTEGAKVRAIPGR